VTGSSSDIPKEFLPFEVKNPISTPYLITLKGGV